jgi:hypothetical protein
VRIQALSDLPTELFVEEIYGRPIHQVRHRLPLRQATAGPRVSVLNYLVIVHARKAASRASYLCRSRPERHRAGSNARRHHSACDGMAPLDYERFMAGARRSHAA